mmetsp:Transcript_19119/g.29962  ORF Transcript_19119/g.29962 Transcript_19119/m.29962 type:complete len:231 (+) Transcript_19119:846-1538(+)
MGIFPVDDGGQSLALMLIHRVPHLAHPRTGSIHNIHIFRIEQRHLLERRPERGQNHHVSIPHLRKVLLPLTNLLDELHVHIVQLIVHLRVVNQFVCDVHLLPREMLHGLVRQGNTTFYAPAESKVLREVDLHAVFIYHKVVGLQFVDEFGFELLGHGFFDALADFLEAPAMEGVGFHVLEALIFLSDGSAFLDGGFFDGGHAESCGALECVMGWGESSGARGDEGGEGHY